MFTVKQHRIGDLTGWWILEVTEDGEEPVIGPVKKPWAEREAERLNAKPKGLEESLYD